MITDERRSTLPDPLPDARTLPRQRRSQAGRRAGLALLAVFVLAGLTGQLGTRTATARASGSGYELSVVHPSVSRSGHAVRFEVRVERDGGLPQDQPLRLRFLSDYFDLFDENAFTPQPDAETQDGVHTVDEFVVPEGDVFVVDVDTRVEPARNTGAVGAVAVLSEDGGVLVQARFRTVIVP